MMEDGGTAARIKQEIDSCCSPSPTSSNNNISILSFGSSGQEPASLFIFKCFKLLIAIYISDGLQVRIRCDNQLGATIARLPRSTVLQLNDIRYRRLWERIEHSGCSEGGITEVKSVTVDKLVSQINPDLNFRRLCLVCGDVASGFHYGVASCEACKAFFKRTIQGKLKYIFKLAEFKKTLILGNIEYTCPANNDCEINKRRRKACQACRFRKCLLMGMLKEGVRLDRVRGGRQKYRRNPNMQPYQLQIPQSSQPPQTLEDIKMLDVLGSFEPEKLCVGHCGIDLMNKHDEEQKNESAGTDAQEMINVLSDLYDKELVGVIGWAKQIPGLITAQSKSETYIIKTILLGFTDLPLNDQMRLLQVSWAEILTLMLAFRSIPFTGRLYFATDFWLDERSAKECGATELFNHVSCQKPRGFCPYCNFCFLFSAFK